jgi:lipopolysaccharide export LptBFGC system permease protein LptF
MSKAPSRADRHRLMTQSLRTPRARPLTAADVNLAQYIRTALGVATIALALLAAAIASVIRRRTLGRSIFVALVLLYVVSWLGAAAIAPIVAPAVSAWLPNAAAATVALGFVLVRARQTWRREMPTV